VSAGDARRIAPQPWMTAPTTRTLIEALAAAGIAARFVGGCVRDALLGRAIADIDLATPAHPEEVIAALKRAHIKVVPTGIEHGTVTAVVGSRPASRSASRPASGPASLGPPRHFEITTLRRDVETYGRRARVAFDADWAEDAARRDFTINAIYLDPDGTLHDPVGGLADLAARRVRFVGEAATRIAEDVLRVLRYYRFEAHFGPDNDEGTGDPAARAACRASVTLLPTLSAERVTQEMIRLLGAPNPVPSLRMMEADGVLAAILPEATRIDRLERLIALETPTLPRLRRGSLPPPLAGEGRKGDARKLPPPQAGEGRGGGLPDPICRLAALVAIDASGAAGVAERLRLSNAERDRLVGLAPPWPAEFDPGAAGDTRAQRQTLYRLGAERTRDLALLIAADGGIDEARLKALLALAAGWTPPAFPLAGRDVTALGIPPGPRIGALLAELRGWWEAGDFTADRTACLAKLREIAAGSAGRVR
jgi:poly(A) polymerase